MIDRTALFVRSVSVFIHKLGSYIFLPAMACVVTIDVILRYVFNSPLLWSQEFNGLCLIIVFCASIVQCWSEGKHVSMKLFSRHFKGKMRLLSNALVALSGILFFGFLGFQTFKQILFMIETRETGEFLPIPFWPVRLFIVLCCLLFCIQLLIVLIDCLFDGKQFGDY